MVSDGKHCCVQSSRIFKGVGRQQNHDGVVIVIEEASGSLAFGLLRYSHCVRLRGSAYFLLVPDWMKPTCRDRMQTCLSTYGFCNHVTFLTILTTLSSNINLLIYPMSGMRTLPFLPVELSCPVLGIACSHLTL